MSTTVDQRRPLNSKTIVLKIGGSFLLTEDGPDVALLKEMADTVRELIAQDLRVVVVVGGGLTARHYIEAANTLGSSKGVMDHLGILVSRLNARVFIEALRDEETVLCEPAENLQQVRTGIQNKKVVVLGGLQPGQSTTAVAALCAEYCSAKMVVYGTDVDGVYTADPNKDPKATKLSHISYEQLRNLIVTTNNSLPGQYRIMDGVALTILERSKVCAQIVMGRKQAILACVLQGQRVGTVIADTETCETA